MDEVPEDRCGYTLSSEEVIGSYSEICCWRPIWEDSDKCIWHANTSEKPAKELIESRSENHERLDGAVLRRVKSHNICFKGCSLVSVDFSMSDFAGVDFSNADLRGADFLDSSLDRAIFDGANLSNCNFSDSKLFESSVSDAIALGSNFSNCKLVDSNVQESDFHSVNFTGAKLMGTSFEGGSLVGVDLVESNLENATLRKTGIGTTRVRNAVVENADLSCANITEVEIIESNLDDVDISDSNLSDVEFKRVSLQGTLFTNSEISRSRFVDSNLRNAEFTDASAQGIVLLDSNLEDSTLIRTDLRDASLKDARLYQTLFADTRINSNTDFGEKSAYEDPDTELGENYEGTSRWEAAAWVYRRLQDLHEENAMSEKAREYHVRKEEAHRSDYWEKGQYFQWFIYTLNLALTNHGESVKRVVYWSIGVILACALAYPFTGGIATGNEVFRATSLSALSLGLVLRSLYFSTVTFTTLGYGDYHPVGEWSKALAGAESLAGALLVALFVFVLGRRVAR